MYKTEMHCHSASVSICAGATADFIVEKYLEAGYTTIVSTEHINDGTYRRMKELPWQEIVDHFLKGRQALEDAAKGRLHILQVRKSRFMPTKTIIWYTVLRKNFSVPLMIPAICRPSRSCPNWYIKTVC